MRPASLEEKKEIEGIKYLKEHNDMTNVDVVLKVYNRIVEEKIFKTAPGVEYLKSLHEFLISSGVDRTLIRPIPIVAIEDAEVIDVKESPKVTKAAKIDVVDLNKKKDIEVNETKVSGNRETKSAAKITDREESRYKNLLITSVILNIVLALVIIGMFIITRGKDDTEVVDYKQSIVDEYASWEDELNDWESELISRENELNFKE